MAFIHILMLFLIVRCADGYYGNPSEPGGFCKPCNCDPNGSIGRGCDANGQCRCRPGIIGRDCSQCAPMHIVSENGCTCKFLLELFLFRSYL